MDLPLIFLDAVAIEEVPIALWRQAFDVLGWPTSLRDKANTFTHHDVQVAIPNDDLSDDFLQALETLHMLGTEDGREAIMSVMSERGAQLPGLPDDSSERELALRLYLAQRTDASMADVFARAQTHVQEEGDRRRYNEFVAKEPRLLRNLDRHREALSTAVLNYCQNSDLGDHVQVSAFADDGIYIFRILRSDRMKNLSPWFPGVPYEL